MKNQIQTLRLLLNKPLSKNSKGVALIQALFLVLLITFIVNQVNFEATVEYTINSQALHRVKAYQAARAGVELSLLRINIYKQALKQFKSLLKDNAQALNMIFSLPITWPMMIPPDASTIDQDALKKITKEALMDATFATQIQTEELFNINDLGSPSEDQQKRIRKKLEDLIKGQIENNQEFAERNQGLDYNEIINNLQDWIDMDTQSRNGGDEAASYSRVRELDQDNQDNFPPNRFFRTIDEIRMVPGINDDLFALISPAFSVFGPMGINPNLAEQDVLKSIHPSINDEIAGKIMGRRSNPAEGGPFKDKNDFFDFVSKEGGRISAEDIDDIPLQFNNEPYSFRIQVTGTSGKTAISITAVTYDISSAQSELDSSSSQSNQNGSGNNNNNNNNKTNGGSGKQQDLPKGPPHIVYWNER